VTQPAESSQAIESRLRSVANRIASHQAAIAELIPERDDLIRQMRLGCYSTREIAGPARISHVTVSKILKATDAS
jgi:hypothetical protein